MVHLVDLPGIYSIAAELGAQERWIAVKLLEIDPWITDRVVAAGAIERDEIAATIARIEVELDEEADVLLADSRYGSIRGLSRDVIKRKLDRQRATSVVDKVVVNRFLGIPIFLGVMYLVFWFTISVGGAFINFFDILFGAVFVDGYVPSRLYRCNALHSRSIGEVNAEAIWAERY